VLVWSNVQCSKLNFAAKLQHFSRLQCVDCLIDPCNCRTLRKCVRRCCLTMCYWSGYLWSLFNWRPLFTRTGNALNTHAAGVFASVNTPLTVSQMWGSFVTFSPLSLLYVCFVGQNKLRRKRDWRFTKFLFSDKGGQLRHFYLCRAAGT